MPSVVGFRVPSMPSENVISIKNKNSGTAGMRKKYLLKLSAITASGRDALGPFPRPVLGAYISATTASVTTNVIVANRLELCFNK